MPLIQFKRGETVRLPELRDGEPAFCTDTGVLYVGWGGRPIYIGGGSGGTEPPPQQGQGRIMIGQASWPPQPRLVSGDATLDEDGVLTLEDMGVPEGPYGDSQTVVQIEVDTKGRVVSIGNTPIVGLVPAGGQAGQVLMKMSSADYDYAWMWPTNTPTTSPWWPRRGYVPAPPDAEPEWTLHPRPIAGALFPGFTGSPSTWWPRTIRILPPPPEEVPATRGTKPNPGALFVVSSAPGITSISPDNGPVAGGTPVTLTGSGFNALTGLITLNLKGVAATGLTIVNDTTATATSGSFLATTGTGNVQLDDGVTFYTKVNGWTYT